ncbi:MAG: trigger factor [Chlamydiia bacterium]|nr:trigger factor [Chlamydiia bacterium]
MSQQVQLEPSEFKNEQLHAVIVPKNACRVEMRVWVTPAFVEMARREAVKTVGKEVMLPGFRKGRAPEQLVRKNFAKQIEKQLHETLSNSAFTEAQKMARVPVLNRQSTVTFDLQKMTEEGAEILFRFETEPHVPSIDPSQFQPQPIPRSEVGETQIEEAVRQMQFYFANWTTVEDRGVQEGDYVIIDLDALDKEPFERVFNEVRCEVSKTRMAEWMLRLIIGAKVGAVLEGISEPDANATEEERKEFKPQKARITLNRIETVLLPALDDAFAQKMGSPNVSQMRTSITERLNRQVDEHVRDKMADQINAFLLTTYPFELPQSLIKTEIDHRFHQLMQDSDFQEAWKQKDAEKKTQFIEEISLEASNALRLFYLSRHIVNEAKIGVSHKEVQDEAVATLRAQGSYDTPLDQISKELYALALSKVILTKAQDFILKKLDPALNVKI